MKLARQQDLLHEAHVMFTLSIVCRDHSVEDML